MTARDRRRQLVLVGLVGSLASCPEVSLCVPPPERLDPDACVGPLATGAEAPDSRPECRHDVEEPNDDLVMAAAPRCGRECAQAERAGRLSTDSDVDVYRTAVCDHGPYPRRMKSWVELETDGPLRVCVFPMCAEGSTNVFDCYEREHGDAGGGDAGPVTAWAANAAAGFRGCCRVGAGRVTAELECVGKVMEMETFVWVDAAGDPLEGNVCPEYTVRYRTEPFGL